MVHSLCEKKKKRIWYSIRWYSVEGENGYKRGLAGKQTQMHRPKNEQENIVVHHTVAGRLGAKDRGIKPRTSGRHPHQLLPGGEGTWPPRSHPSRG